MPIKEYGGEICWSARTYSTRTTRVCTPRTHPADRLSTSDQALQAHFMDSQSGSNRLPVCSLSKVRHSTTAMADSTTDAAKPMVILRPT